MTILQQFKNNQSSRTILTCGTCNTVKYDSGKIRWRGVVYNRYGMVEVEEYLASEIDKFIICLTTMINGRVFDTYFKSETCYVEQYLATIATKWLKQLRETQKDSK